MLDIIAPMGELLTPLAGWKELFNNATDLTKDGFTKVIILLGFVAIGIGFVTMLIGLMGKGQKNGHIGWGVAMMAVGGVATAFQSGKILKLWTDTGEGITDDLAS